MEAYDREFFLGRMWGQLKVLKPKLSYRPIIDNSFKLGVPLEQMILTTLNDIFNAKEQFSIKNSVEAIQLLKEKFGPGIFIQEGHRMISADFTSMYTNILTKKAIDLVQKLWDEHIGPNVNNLQRMQDGMIPLLSGAMA